ncbi:MAG: EAL domain-containing protein [Thermoanaerobaculia bacterium]|nr:EAL domain-containing protein [Thermoanaerobaculia bacterium]
MISWFRDLPIRWKLILIITSGCFIALLLAGMVFVSYQVVVTRQMLADQLHMSAHIAGSACAAAIAFERPADASETLQSLELQRDLIAAAVFTQDDRLFASYVRPGQSFELPPRSSASTVFAPDWIEVSNPVTEDGQQLGVIVLWADYSRVNEQLVTFLGHSAAVLLVVLLVAFAFSTRLQRSISEPVADLVRTADAITAGQDFSLRVEPGNRDEIGRLVASFNRMLAEIERRDSALRLEIEERVRTSEALRQSERDYRGLFENAHDAIVILDVENRVVLEANDRACELYGMTRSEFIGSSILARSKGPARGRSLATEVFTSGSAVRFQSTQFKKDGEELILDVIASAIHYRGEPAILSLNRDITEEHRAILALRRSEERYALAARASNDGLWDWDLVTGTLQLSPRWKEIVGLSDDEVSEVPASWLDRVHPSDAPDFASTIQAHVNGLTSCLESEHRILHRNGEYRWVLCRGMAVYEEGKAIRLAGSMSDITDRKRAEARLVHDALHDSLTGLPNRLLFMDRLGHVLRRRHESQPPNFAVLYLDLDRFKVINDSMGHDVGDRLLREIGKRLSEVVRASDTAARLGGDEFAILLEDLDSLSRLISVAQRIEAELSRPFLIGGTEIHTRPSIGIAPGDSQSDRPEELIRRADVAMYAAKRRGSGYSIYDEAMHEEVVGRMRLETELHSAIEQGQFFLQYQPIFALDGARLTGFEALLRWRHPERGVISPAQFIPMLEETRLIVPLTRWVLKAASSALDSWTADLPASAPLVMSVNISAVHFALSNIVDEIKQAVGEPVRAGRRLGIEVTESALMENPDVAERQLEALRAMGVETSVDDFGTGYSSLAYLSRLPFDKIKIDRTFVSRIGSDTSGLGIVRAIVALAHDLRKELVAEGVETPEQLVALEALGCEHAQGFLFARPLPEAEARALVLRQLTEARSDLPAGRPPELA